METKRLPTIDATAGTHETTPFIIWKYEVEMMVIRCGFNGEDVRAAGGKLQMWWNAGESMTMAAHGLLAMVKGLISARREDSETNGLRTAIHAGRMQGRQT